MFSFNVCIDHTHGACDLETSTVPVCQCFLLMYVLITHMVHVILRHLLYLYFMTKKASLDTILIMLLDTILNNLLLYILFYLLFTSFVCFCMCTCMYVDV